MRFATDLASLYLRTDVIPDRVYTDSIDLWNLRFDIGRRWGVGVNVFAIQGDRRWWHDHRIPGGLAFSMNSVGHMVAAEARRTAIIQAQKTVSELKASTKTVKLNKLEAEMAQLAQTSIHSLDHALKFAMHTINNASYEEDTVCPWWPKATSLMREGPDSRCPIPLVAADPVLNGMNWTTYLGWYHTDITVPSEYFQIDQSRPKSIKVPLALDFSYLHSKRELDFKKLAQGKLIKERARIRRIARAQKTS
jgi:hypothetical protein